MRRVVGFPFMVVRNLLRLAAFSVVGALLLVVLDIAFLRDRKQPER